MRIPTLEPNVLRSEERAEELVGDLVAAGAHLSIEGADLVFSGPAHTLRQEMIAELRQEKNTVISLLERNRARGVLRLGSASWEQRRMEWRNRTDRCPATYNVCLRVDLEGDVHPRPLARTIAALVNRHEILRTRFAWYGEHLLQEIMAVPRSVLQILQPSVLCGAADQELADWCSRRGAAAFDLAAEAPARWCYAPLAPQRAILLVTLHHIACDGWSIKRLLNEFESLYRAEEHTDEMSVLSSVTITPRDFAEWESKWLSHERLDHARSFWAEELQGAVLAPTLTRSKSKVGIGGEAAAVVRPFTAAVATSVTTMARSLALSEFSIYFAAFAMLLREETDGRDCVVVIAVANRIRPDHEELVGLTRNAQPIRCSAKPGESIDVVARKISARVEHALAYQWCPIGLIVPPDDTVDSADLRRLPITFGLERSSDPNLHCDQLSATVRDVFLGAARASFSLLVRRHNDTAEAFFEFSKAQLCPEVVELLADRYVQIVTAEVGRWM